MELLVKTPFDVRSCFETSLPAAFSLYIATKSGKDFKPILTKSKIKVGSIY